METEIATLFAQYGIEGVALGIFVWFVRGLLGRVKNLVDTLEKVATAHGEHIVKENTHHDNVDKQMAKQSAYLSKLSKSGDHTPVAGISTIRQ